MKRFTDLLVSAAVTVAIVLFATAFVFMLIMSAQGIFE